MLLGITQGLLVAAGASADDIAYPREDVRNRLAPTMASPETMPRYSTILRPSIPSVVTISIAASCLRRGSQPTPLAPARDCCKLSCQVLTPRQPSGDAQID